MQMTTLLSVVATVVSSAMLYPIDRLDDENGVVIRIYNIQDLEFVASDKLSAPQMNMGLNLNNSPLVNSNAPNIQIQKLDSTELIALIESLIEPDIWENGTSSITYWRGNLIVRAPQHVQDKIK